MSKSITLSGNQELQFVTDSWEKTVTVYLFDTISDTRVTLTEFVGGKWTSKSNAHLDKFFELIKVNPKIRVAMKKAFGELKTETPVSTFQTTLSCFKRRFIIKIKKLVK
jgi:hypothetical protein